MRILIMTLSLVLASAQSHAEPPVPAYVSLSGETHKEAFRIQGGGYTEIVTYRVVSRTKASVPAAARPGVYEFEKGQFGLPKLLAPISQDGIAGLREIGFIDLRGDGWVVVRDVVDRVKVNDAGRDAGGTSGTSGLFR